MRRYSSPFKKLNINKHLSMLMFLNNLNLLFDYCSYKSIDLVIPNMYFLSEYEYFQLKEEIYAGFKFGHNLGESVTIGPNYLKALKEELLGKTLIKGTNCYEKQNIFEKSFIYSECIKEIGPEKGERKFQRSFFILEEICFPFIYDSTILEPETPPSFAVKPLFISPNFVFRTIFTEKI